MGTGASPAPPAAAPAGGSGTAAAGLSACSFARYGSRASPSRIVKGWSGPTTDSEQLSVD